MNTSQTATRNRNIKRLIRKIIMKITCRSFFVPSKMRARICAYCGVKITDPKSVFIGDDVLLDDSHPELIEIGRKVWITNNVKIYTHFLDINYEGTIDEPYQFYLGKVIIEDFVFIGSNVSIVKPVRIGRGAIIAANSVVINDVLPNSIVAGSPAKEIGKRPPIK